MRGIASGLTPATLAGLAGLAALGFSGCGRGSPPPTFSSRDSAGVTIADSHTPAWAAGQAWSVATTPEVRIGTVDGPEAYRLFEVGDATVLFDGRIAVANSGTHEVRLYSRTGTWIRTIGRQGEGPGEFTYPHRMYRLPGDSLVVVDSRALSLFDSAGTFVRSYPRGAPVYGRFADGRYLVELFAAGTHVPDNGIFHPRVALVLLRPGEPSDDTLAIVDGNEMYDYFDRGRVMLMPRPLGKTLSVAVRGGELATGDGTTFEIRVLKEGGTLECIMRRDADLTVERSDIERYEAILDSMGTGAQRQRRILKELGYPDRLPAYDRLLYDADGNLWARRYTVGTEEQRWSVFDPSGRWLGGVSLPADLQVFEIGADYVLGATQDSLGVEYVEEHRLEKPAT